VYNRTGASNGFIGRSRSQAANDWGSAGRRSKPAGGTKRVCNVSVAAAAGVFHAYRGPASAGNDARPEAKIASPATLKRVVRHGMRDNVSPMRDGFTVADDRGGLVGLYRTGIARARERPCLSRARSVGLVRSLVARSGIRLSGPSWVDAQCARPDHAADPLMSAYSPDPNHVRSSELRLVDRHDPPAGL
jgi:hypothetical protein